MFAGRDFDPSAPRQPCIDAVAADLELEHLFSAMAGDDQWLLRNASKTVTQLLVDVGEIRYRQDALKDCIEREGVVRRLYDLATGVLEAERRRVFRSSRSPSAVMYWSVEVLKILVEGLRDLRRIADAAAGSFASDAFQRFFTTVRLELSDEYLAEVEQQLRKLKFRDGMLLSARLGEGNKGTDYVLCDLPSDDRGWLARLFDFGSSGPHTFRIADRDDAGARALSSLRDRGLNVVANAVAQSCDHLVSFFEMLRTELAFYVGCLNLHARLTYLGVPISFPEPLELGTRFLEGRDIVDPCLALRMSGAPVANDLDGDGANLLIFTGANQGGKSTFLRALGVACVMMQCGMFVAVRSFRASVSANVFTHFRREEDATMKSGKLDEELHRMSDLVDALRPDSMVLFNESFSSTNEQEGSEIARQIVAALLEARQRLAFVTHQHEFARTFLGRSDVVFMRAQRLDDGTRTFKLLKAEPLRTSFGPDLFRTVFGETPTGLARGAPLKEG